MMSQLVGTTVSEKFPHFLGLNFALGRPPQEPTTSGILILWHGFFQKLMGIFNIEVIVQQQCGWKCSNITGFVSGFSRVEFSLLPAIVTTEVRGNRSK
jgi:hypothetical protein